MAMTSRIELLGKYQRTSSFRRAPLWRVSWKQMFDLAVGYNAAYLVVMIAMLHVHM